MSKTKRAWDPLTEDRRSVVIREVVTFFHQNQEHEIGNIAAEEILDFFLQTLEHDFYRKAISDAKQLIHAHAEALEIDLDVLPNR